MKDYKLFQTQHSRTDQIEDVISEIIYQYLFMGTSVKGIEEILFGSAEFSGFFSKGILNFFGIDTSRESENRGIYKGCGLYETAHALLLSEDESRKKVGRLLLHRLGINPHSLSSSGSGE